MGWKSFNKEFLDLERWALITQRSALRSLVLPYLKLCTLVPEIPFIVTDSLTQAVMDVAATGVVYSWNMSCLN